MTQQAERSFGTFGPWVAAFRQNEHVHAKADAAIAFDDRCDIPDSVRRPLIESVAPVPAGRERRR